MGEPITDGPQNAEGCDQWMQAVLPLSSASMPDGDLLAEGALLDVIREALHLADDASDGHTRHEALACVSAHLAAQATARGRRPVPKPFTGRSGRGDRRRVPRDASIEDVDAATSQV
jgi:hypothetical protein